MNDEELRLYLEHRQKCQAVHFGAVGITEMAGSRIAWSGQVVIFNLIGHASAKWCYVLFRDGESREPLIMLGVPPVTSPRTAVKLALSQAKGQGLSADL